MVETLPAFGLLYLQCQRSIRKVCVMQEVVANLMISRIEVRGEEDADVAAYQHATAKEVRVVRPSREVDAARSVLMQSFRRIMDQLAHSKVRKELMLWHASACCPWHCVPGPVHSPRNMTMYAFIELRAHRRGHWPRSDVQGHCLPNLQTTGEASYDFLSYSIQRESEKWLYLQAYYGKLDAEIVTRYGLQRAMSGLQATNRGGDIFMIFKQACTLCLYRIELTV